MMRWTSPRKCLRRMRLDASSELRYAASIAPALDVMTTGGGSVGGRDARVRTNDDETKSISPAASSVFRSDGAVSAAVARVAMPASPRAAAAAAASDDAAAGVALPCHPGVFLAVVVALVSVAVSWLDLARETTLGIDLGTTHSVAATCDKGVVSVVRVDGGVRADGGWDDGDDDDGFGGFGGGLTLPSVVRFERRRRSRRRKDDDDDDDDDSYDVVAIGAPAARARAVAPSRVVYDAKRVIGRAWADPVVREEADAMPFRVVKRRGNGDDLDDLDDGVAFALTDEDDDDEFLEDVFAIVSPEEVSARVLRHLKRAAEASMSRARRALGFKFASATISVPVEFGAAQRAATIRAAERAGFASTRLIEEPVAAAIAHGLDARYNNNNASSSDVTSSSGDSRLVVVYDLGGGTLDVAVLRLDPETRTFLVMGTAGDPRLGGEDFDRALLTLVEGRLSRISIASSGAGMRERAMREVERAKRAIGSGYGGRRRSAATMRFCGGGGGAGPAPATSVSLLLDDDASGSSSGGGDDHLLCEDVVLSGDDITLASEALLSRATTPVRDALRRAGEVSPAEVDDVVLVGGGTRLLAVRERLGEVFEGRELRDGVDPALAIAIGAARSYAC